MTNQQKKAATGLSLGIVALAAAFLLWLTFAVVAGTARGDQMPGSFFMLVISSGGGLGTALRTLPLLLSVGLAALGAYKLKDFLFYIIILVSAAGFLSSLYLFFQLRSDDTARPFFQYTPIQAVSDYDSFVGGVQTSLGVAAGWFLTAILLELGIKGAVSLGRAKAPDPANAGVPDDEI